MRIGYPCINRGIGCTAGSTFRLASYSRERLVETVGKNLSCLSRVLEYNAANGLLFFRITSDIVPFASHPACTHDWKLHFSAQFRAIGALIRGHGMRISMHPDQFVLLNSPDEGVTERSIAELGYHCSVLDAMELDCTAKVQIHAGGVYGDREQAVMRFCKRYAKLPPQIRRRLAIENDDRLYSLKDCLGIHDATGVPVIFDSFHHECLGNGESVRDAASLAAGCWKSSDGPLMMDYSSQKKGARKGTHAETIDLRHFRKVLAQVRGLDPDLMLEIKDKEKSAIKALGLAGR